MATKFAVSVSGSLDITQGRGRIISAWSQVVQSRPAASTQSDGFVPAVLEADSEAIYDFALASILGPSLEQAEADFSAGQTFTLNEWLEDSGEDT